MYQKQMIAGWGDMDFNAHMRNTAFLDKSGDVRMMYFAENGFPMSQFARLKIGPVIVKDEIEYFREIHLLEEFCVHLGVAGLSEDGGRFSFTNAFYREDGRMAARVTSQGGWLDLETRKLARPPELAKVLINAPRSEDFRPMRLLHHGHVLKCCPEVGEPNRTP